MLTRGGGDTLASGHMFGGGGGEELVPTEAEVGYSSLSQTELVAARQAQQLQHGHHGQRGCI